MTYLLGWTTPPIPTSPARTSDRRDRSYAIDPDGTGHILCGLHPGGRFTWETIPDDR